MSQIPPPLPRDPSSPYQPPAAPPTMSGAMGLPPEPPKWPKVVGIISIVWGSLGTVCNSCGIAGEFFKEQMKSFVPADQQNNPAFNQPMSVPVVIVQSFGIAVAAFLIVAGIFCIQRKPITRLMHLAYGAVAVLLTIIGSFLAWGNMQGQMQAATPQEAAAMKLTLGISLALGVCFGMAYPLFCLVWFGLVKRTAASFGPAAARDVI